MTSRRTSASRSQTPPPSPEPDPLPSPSPSPFFQSPETGPELLDPEPNWSTSPDPLDGPASASPSGTPSTPADKPKPPLSKTQLKELTRPAVAQAGETLQGLLTRPESLEREVGLWEADEQDCVRIGDPLAGIVSRRIPAGTGGTDTADLVYLAVGVLGYLAKQWSKRAQVRAYKRENMQPVDQTADMVDDVQAAA